MQMRNTFLLFVVACFLSGCMSQTAIPPYAELVKTANVDDTVSVKAIEDAFGTEQIDGELLLELAKYEQSALNLRSQPLQLGAIGSAILDRYYASVVGHWARVEYYEHLGEKRAEFHRGWITRITKSMMSGREGTFSSPYRALTVPQAKAVLLMDGYQAIGGRYEGTESTPFAVRIMRKREDQLSDDVVFDLSESFAPLVTLIGLSEDANYMDQRSALVSMLATRGDPVAQLNLGMSYAAENNIEPANRWIGGAIQGRNYLGFLVSAETSVNYARTQAENERRRAQSLRFARHQYEQAIEHGHDSALYDLGMLYVQGVYGTDVRTHGIELLERAAKVKHIPSTQTLAQILAYSDIVPQDNSRAAELYAVAAAQGSQIAKLQYFRLLSDSNSGLSLNKQAVDWLLEEAEKDNAMAMYEVGNCHAKGCLEKPNYRKAQGWYRRAVRAEPENPNVINGVAWTLTVSHIKELRRPRFALRIIERMMQNNTDARSSPQFIDTWAAAYAAVGNFERAVELQREALQRATDGNGVWDRVIPEIQSHLQSFSNGETLTEHLP